MTSDEIKGVIKHYCKCDVKSIQRMSGGISFEVNKIILLDGRKMILRYGRDYINTGNRKMIISQIYEREKYFYDTVNAKVDIMCPRIQVIDDKYPSIPDTFELYEYIEGESLGEVIKNFSEQDIENVNRDIGRLVAAINNLQISEEHPFIKQRGSWNLYFATRLKERLMAVLKNDIITEQEIEKIYTFAVKKNQNNRALSFLHLDVRYNNFLWDNKVSSILDAENSEWGDPYYELARIDVYGLLDKAFLEGYQQISAWGKIDLECIEYKIYKMESVAFLLNVFLNEIDASEEEKETYRSAFLDLKAEILLCSKGE